MKGKHIPIIIIVCLIFICSIGFMAMSTWITASPINLAVQHLEDIHADPSSKQVVAIINDSETITEADVSHMLALSEAAYEMNKEYIQNSNDYSTSEKKELLDSLEPETRNQIIKKLVEKKVLLQKATELGITVTETEIEELIQSNHAAMNEGVRNNDPASITAKAVYDSYIESLGITPEEYIEEYESPIIKEAIMLQKLKEYITADLSPLEKENIVQVDRIYNDYISDVIDAATIEYPE